jgi:hypothetical protein
MGASSTRTLAPTILSFTRLFHHPQRKHSPANGQLTAPPPPGERKNEENNRCHHGPPHRYARPEMGGRDAIDWLLNGALPAWRCKPVRWSPFSPHDTLRAPVVQAVPERTTLSGSFGSTSAAVDRSTTGGNGHRENTSEVSPTTSTTPTRSAS